MKKIVYIIPLAILNSINASTKIDQLISVDDTEQVIEEIATKKSDKSFISYVKNADSKKYFVLKTATALIALYCTLKIIKNTLQGIYRVLFVKKTTLEKWIDSLEESPSKLSKVKDLAIGAIYFTGYQIVLFFYIKELKNRKKAFEAFKNT